MNQPPTKTTTESLTPSYVSLKVGKANKTGQRSHGQIHYRILTDAGQQALYLIITGNDGGGYYSREIVPFEHVEQCLEGINTLKPLSSKIFQSAFTGQSSNNAGFLAAILRAEKLLLPVPESIHQHAVQANWIDWKTATLALADKADSYQMELPKPRIVKEVISTGTEASEPDDVDMMQPQITNQDDAGVETESIAGVLDKNTAKKQRSEKHQHPTGKESHHDSVSSS